MEELLKLKSINIRRVVEKDCNLIFNWANDEASRKNSFSGEMIEYEEHKKWFGRKIKDENSYLFILVDNNLDIGLLRLEVVNDEGIISYSISKDFRGKGYGYKIIEQIEKLVKIHKISIDKLYAEVKYNNRASQKIFEKLGYQKYMLEDKLVYKKNLQ